MACRRWVPLRSSLQLLRFSLLKWTNVGKTIAQLNGTCQLINCPLLRQYKSFKQCRSRTHQIFKVPRAELSHLPFFSGVRGGKTWHQAPCKTARVPSPRAWWSRQSPRTWLPEPPCLQCPASGPGRPFPVASTLRNSGGQREIEHTHTQMVTGWNMALEEILWLGGN